jgi:transposase-like protein
MKAKKYSEEQIIAVLKEGEAGAKVADLCRKYGMSDATYYNEVRPHSSSKGATPKEYAVMTAGL